MNHSAAVCRQCSKTYTDIGDEKPYCAECLLTMQCDQAPVAMTAIMDALATVASVAEERGNLHAIESVDAVVAWLMGGERPSTEALWSVAEVAMGCCGGEDAANGCDELGNPLPEDFFGAAAELLEFTKVEAP